MEMQARVDQLERSVRRLTAALGGVVLLAVVVVGAGAQPGSGRLDVREIVLRDAKGKVRAILSTDAQNGVAFLGFNDAAGDSRAMISVMGDGHALIECYGPGEKGSASIVATAHGEPFFEATDAAGRTIYQQPKPR